MLRAEIGVPGAEIDVPRTDISVPRAVFWSDRVLWAVATEGCQCAGC